MSNDGTCCGSGKVAPPKRYAHIDYKVVYPATDTEGNKLGDIVGAYVEVKAPGDCEWRRTDANFIKYPFEKHQVKVAKDGIWRLRHVVVGSCRESLPSDELFITVNVMPPTRPKAPTVDIPCAPHDGATTNVMVEWCYPDKDLQGDNLLHISGAVVQISPPGSGEWFDEKRVQFPQNAVELQLPGDGLYRTRVRILGACSESEHSDPTAIKIDVAAPAKPPTGEISTPCPFEFNQAPA